MIKYILPFLVLWQLTLRADIFEIRDFESDIFSKEGNKLKQVTLSVWLEGKDLDRYGFQIKDTLNIIISSFYLEDLLTSKGKERFKDSFTAYLTKHYSIALENIYINTMKRTHNSLDIDELIEALKEAGFIQKRKTIKKVFEALEE